MRLWHDDEGWHFDLNIEIDPGLLAYLAFLAFVLLMMTVAALAGALK